MDEARSVILEVVEVCLEAQLKAIRKLHGKDVNDAGRTDKPKEKRNRSQPGMAVEVLRKAGKPLHINDIVDEIGKSFGVKTERDTLVSALTKKVVKGDTFIRTNRNTFYLKG